MTTDNMQQLTTGEHVDADDWRRLVAMSVDAFKDICTTHGVWPGEIHRKKTQAIARAREEFVAHIRRHVWCRRMVADHRERILVFHFGTDPPPKYRSVSYPILALLLGVDHTALVHGSKRHAATEGTTCDEQTNESTPAAASTPDTDESTHPTTDTHTKTTVETPPAVQSQTSTD